jgi:ABC-type bacteriocin/lantibiotic exporter with double-glycine peptidase domain
MVLLFLPIDYQTRKLAKKNNRQRHRKAKTVCMKVETLTALYSIKKMIELQRLRHRKTTYYNTHIEDGSMCYRKIRVTSRFSQEAGGSGI